MEHLDKRNHWPEPESPERRALLQGILVMLSGVTITITGCGGDDGDGGPTSPGGSETGSISANHGHEAVILAAQLTAGNAISLQIRGSSTHPHTVDLSAAEIGQIAANQQVSKTSSTDASNDFGTHNHQVTFN